MKKISLTKGKFAIVDNEDYERLKQYKWQYNNIGYASRDIVIDGKPKKLLMHRDIMNTPKGMDTDHINGERLDNRKINLRIVTHQKNMWNIKKMPNHNTSGHMGVSWQINRHKWQVGIKVSGKRIHIGNFLYIQDAIKAYQLAKIKYHKI